MIKAFSKYIDSQNLFQKKDRILIAVSGGVDSVVLCYLSTRANIDFGIAHCNYQLRGEDSDKDEQFVKTLAEELNVPHFSIRFETKGLAKERKQSIQELARDLRYEWLENIREKNSFQYIATAHHSNDSIETVLYNFSKGCGIRGLHGILPQKENIVRPLLFASKEEILAYASNENISFREDISNATDKYSRNKIRNHVIPVLQDLNPNFEETAIENLKRIQEAEALFDFALEVISEELTIQEGNFLKINIEKLCASPAPSTVLYEFIKPFGFNGTQVINILQIIDSQPGKTFNSISHQLLIDRKFIIISNKENYNGVKYFIDNIDSTFELKDSILQFEVLQTPALEIEKSKNKAYLDFEKLKFPLVIRTWEPGDVFQPFGMQGRHKKLQDLFSDLKLNRFEKEKVWILEADGEICWVVGIRIDDRFKVSQETKKCLVINWKPNTFAS